MQVNMTTQYLHSIIDENEQLRLRVAKLEQIQKYMEALLKRCEQLEFQKNHFARYQQQILQQNESLRKQLNKVHQSHKEEIKMVLFEHDSIMRKMQEQLKVIKMQYQRQSQISDELREGKNSKQSELRILQEQFKSLTKQADKQIQALKQALVLNQKQYQFLLEQSKHNKSQFLNEKQDLMKQLYHLKAVVGRQMKRHIQQIQMLNTSLTKQAEGLRKYNQQIARNATLRQKQLSQQIKIIKADFETREQLLKNQIQTLERTLLQKTEQSSKRLDQTNILIDENIRLKRQLDISLSNENKFCFMLEQSQKQNFNLRQKLVEIDSYLQDQTERYKQQFFDQRNHNTELRKVLSDKQMIINQKLRQIKDLLNIIDEIESALKLKDKQIDLFKNQLDKMEAQVKVHIKNFEDKNLEWRTLEQKNRSLKVSVEQLQVLNGSLKKQILECQTANHNLKRQLLNPRASNKQSQQKIQTFIQSFRRQKQILLQQHQIEKNKIKEHHQFQIKQKQLQFLRKIQYFQEELKRIK